MNCSWERWWLSHYLGPFAGDIITDVPRPLGLGDNAILMENVGALEMPAPALSQVTLRTAEARPLFVRLLGNVEIMLAYGCVHGDLSAYNVLYWQGQVKVIDFPQAVDAHLHPDAYALLQRDVDKLCRYFARYGIAADAAELAAALWARCGGEPVSDLALDAQNARD